MTSSSDACGHCGAPRVSGYAECKFCKTPFVANTREDAIPCPRCETLNELGSQQCVQCKEWVVVRCVFCSVLSPHHLPSCLQCGEVFAGAPERLAQRQEEASRAKNMQIAATVGGVAAQLLGGVAAGMIAGHSRSFFDSGPDVQGVLESGGSDDAAGGVIESLFGDSDSDD